MRKAQLTIQPKEKMLVEARLRGLTIEKAAIEAGYPARSAAVTGFKVLKRPRVAQYMATREASMAQKTDNIRERVIEELSAIAFANMKDFMRIDEDGNPIIDLSGATPEQLRVLNKVETKKRSVYSAKGEHLGDEVTVKIAKDDKLRGLQMLGQTIGLFKPEEVKVTVDVADRLLAARARLAQLPGYGTTDEDVPD